MFEQIQDPARRAMEEEDYKRLMREIADTKERLQLAPTSEKWKFRESLGKLKVDWAIARLKPLMSNMDDAEKGVTIGIMRGRKRKGDQFRLSGAQWKMACRMVRECKVAHDEALIE